MFSIIGIDHVVILCRDIKRSMEFYNRILGCRLERTVASVPLYQLRAGNTLIDLQPVEQQPAGQNMEHFCLRIRPFDADKLLPYFQAEGVRLLSAVERRYGATGFGDSLYIEDPDGNCVELKAEFDDT
ncbi:VOC family protein [Pontibacter sp. JAM-7]|uniref:VOC family protein n=1 Tax=Pontibacter sp. JAM-7 TaxID=3366581 RepID=UPI003AF5181D